MFERFTDRARRVVVISQEEARLMNSNCIGTEHIFLGLLHEDGGVAGLVLREDLGLDLAKAQETVMATIEEAGIKLPEGAPSGHIPFTPRAKKVLELSLREALQLGHNYIGTEHILLGLIREGEGIGAQVLVKMGADLSTSRQAVIQRLAGYAKGEESRPEEQRPDVRGQLEKVEMIVQSARRNVFEGRIQAKLMAIHGQVLDVLADITAADAARLEKFADDAPE